METPTNTEPLPESMLTEILAKLPLRSISRFKSVSKTWKTTLESVYFRRHFLSLHQKSSSSWSLIRGEFMGKELIGFYGCEAWDLPKSPASYIPPPSNLSNRSYFAISSFSNGLVLMEGYGYFFFVGNPVLQQWAKIPCPPYDTSRFGLVTRVDVDGVVLSFKIVRKGEIESSTSFIVRIYSSETGIWTSKRLHLPCHIPYSSPMSLNETIYLLCQTDFQLPEPGELIAHDFYSESDQCQVISLPDHLNHNSNNGRFKRALTTSGGFVMYIKTLPQEVDDVLKVWRLRKDSTWELLWEIHLPIIRSDIGYNAPMAMHPFDSDIVYIWSQQNRHMVSCNLRTQNCRILRDASKWYNDNHQNCFMNRFICQKYMDEIWGPRSVWGYGDAVALFQFVLPRWMESIPCPPQIEMINTTSLLSYISSMKKRKRDIGKRVLDSIISVCFFVSFSSNWIKSYLTI